MSATRIMILFAAVVMASAAHAANSRSDACKQSAFLFAKLAIASGYCNFQASKSLSVFADTAIHFCGKGPASAWPGSKAGAMAFYAEVKKEGEAAVCARIGGEMIGLDNSTPSPDDKTKWSLSSGRSKNYCIGTLKYADGLALFNDSAENDQPCNILSGQDDAMVRRACPIGATCIVFGKINRDCKKVVEGCPEVTHVTAAYQIN